MKKLLVLIAILCVASWANASLQISVNGVVDPVGPITVGTSEHLVLDVSASGEPTNKAVWMIVQGPGTISGGTLLYNGAGGLSDINEFGKDEIAYYTEDPVPVAVTWGEYFASEGFSGVGDTIHFFQFVDTIAPNPPALNGKLVDGIDFHCEGLGIMVVTLLNSDTLAVYDTQIIYEIPEPTTIALLCLGGLMLRRRK
jgi:hypothetical protein